jgi:hypothetical protein
MLGVRELEIKVYPDQLLNDCKRQFVSGRSKPATDGRLKTSHFEETQIRQIGSKESPFSLEHYHE